MSNPEESGPLEVTASGGRYSLAARLCKAANTGAGGSIVWVAASQPVGLQPGVAHAPASVSILLHLLWNGNVERLKPKIRAAARRMERADMSVAPCDFLRNL